MVASLSAEVLNYFIAGLPFATKWSFIELVDETLGSEVNIEEAETMVKVALLCTNASPTLRPTMSEVVSMLEGRMAVPATLPELSSNTEDLRFKAMRDLLLK